MKASFPIVSWAGSGSKFQVLSGRLIEFVHEVWTSNKKTSQIPPLAFVLSIYIIAFYFIIIHR